MCAPPTALVWFKRDLRLRDHAPLAQAAHFERSLGLVLIEPEWLNSPECDPRHVAYLLACVAALQREHGFTHLFSYFFSHEETGPGWSCARDIAVGRWCRARGLAHLVELSGWPWQRLPARPLQPADRGRGLQPAQRTPGLWHAVDALRAPGHRGPHPLHTPPPAGLCAERLFEPSALALPLQ